MKRIFTSASLVACLLFVAPSFAAEPAAGPRPVVVVEVSGDLDAAAVREAVAAELGADVVTPEDARAAEATRTVQARGDSGAKKLSVTLRTSSAPVTRTVTMPDDVTVRPKTVRFLAGNLARDEASALLEELKTKAPEAPPPAEKRPRLGEEEQLRYGERMERLHGFLDVRAESEKRRYRRKAALELAVGAVELAGGAALLATAPDPQATVTSAALPRTYHTELGATLVTFGSLSVLLGAFAAFANTPHEELRDEARKVVTDPSAVDAFEKSWKERADESRVSQKRQSVFVTVVGAVLVGAGVGIAVGSDDPLRVGSALGLGTVGLVMGGIGVLSYGNQTELERSLADYRALAYLPAPAQAASSRPKVGFAPTRGGGGMASLSFTF